jgi:hypothetical protein
MIYSGKRETVSIAGKIYGKAQTQSMMLLHNPIDQIFTPRKAENKR